jgi:hypothetical protein
MIDITNKVQLKESFRLETKKAAGGVLVSLWETYIGFCKHQRRRDSFGHIGRK